MYEPYEIILAIMGGVLSMLASISLGKALQIGLGGPVQAITNLMSLVQTILAAAILG